MKPITAVFAAVLLLGTGVALAQTAPAQSPAGANQPSAQQQDQSSTTMQSPASQPSSQPQSQGTMSGQSSMGSQTQATAGQQSVVGCVMKSGNDFYIVPDKGTPVKLRSKEDLSAKQNHYVGVTGQYENGSSAVSSQSGSSASAGQDFQVTKVDEIAANCPGRGSASQGAATSTPGASTPGSATPGAATPGASTPGASTPGASGSGTGNPPR